MPPVVTSSHRKHSRRIVALIAFAAVLVLIAFAFAIRALVFVSRGTPAQPVPAQPVVSATTAERPAPPSKEPSPLPTASNERRTEEAGPLPARPAVPDYVSEDYIPKPGQMQLPSGKILTFPPPKPGEIRMLAAYGHIYECYADGGWKDATPRKLFGTAFEENFLALSVEGRTFIPAFLTGLDQDDVVRVLQKEYEPIGDETDEEKAQLAAYDEMRAAALDYIAGGGSFDEFVTEIATFVKQERSLKAKALREVMTLFKEGRVDEAKVRAEALNEALATQGFSRLRLPAHVRSAFGEEVPTKQ